MKRREFLKSTLILAAVSTIVGKASGIFSNVAHAAAVKAAIGKLGYKDVSPQKANGKQCSTCKHFKASPEAGAGNGECVLAAMKNAMKPATQVWVANEGYCNMWAKKA
jgi:anaerobic selenocysteine-containing dehydrogenase